MVAVVKTERSYQDFDGNGSSKSHEKLEALRLRLLGNRSKNDKAPLDGLKVLDIGCNEGFFCAEAIKQGASRVLGIDFNKKWIDKAKVRVPEAEFRTASWWDLPDEKFDVIFFLSAIHYEQEQRELLDYLRSHLTQNGTLVLECGIVPGPDRRWGTIKRHDGPRRYPTNRLLKEDLLTNYMMTNVGPSTDQKGDPVSRFVFHCTPKRQTVLLIAGVGGTGKTTLAYQFEQSGIPTFSTDFMFRRLRDDPGYSWRRLASLVKKHPDAPVPANWSKVAITLVEDPEAVDEICNLIVAEASLESDICCIEGDLLRHPQVLAGVTSRLEGAGMRVWNMRPQRTPSGPSPAA